MSPEQKVALARQIGPADLQAAKDRRAAFTSFAEFVRQAWDLLEPGTPLTWNWHIDLICAELERVTRGETKQLLLNVPPGMMKSLLVSVFWPAWNWLHRPAFRSIHCAYQQDVAIRDSKKCREIIGSDWYQALIRPDKKTGQKWTIDKNTDSMTKFANTKTGFRQCTSPGGQGTGLRASAVIVDDPQNAEEYPTAETLDKIKSWWDLRMSSRGAKQKDAIFIIIMQRLHDNDLAGYVIQQDKANEHNPAWRPYKKIILPNEYDPDSPCPGDPRTERGELLHPAHFDEDDTTIQKIKLGDYGYSAQYQQRPVPAGGGIFKVWKLKFHYSPQLAPPPPHFMPDQRGTLVACEQAPTPTASEFMVQAQSWDCSFKELSTSDFVCGQTWGRTKPHEGRGSAFYLLDCEYGRMGVTETVSRIRSMAARNPRAIAKYVEDKANGSAVIQILQKDIFGLIEINPKGGKESRAWACSPFVDAGNVWLPHPAQNPWVLGLIKEMSSFPRGAHDDQVDAMTQCLLQIHEQDVSHLLALTRW